jgi:multiple sugar transport system substrate-binding protein
VGRRRTALIATLAAIVPLVLGACGSSGSGSGESGSSGDGGPQVTISYWQYTYATKVTEIKKLIKEFEAKNPNIKVQAEDYPHDQFQNKVFAAQKAGTGPDIVNIYNGWVAQFVKQKAIQPIPSDFMSTQDIKDYYVSTVQPQSGDGKFYSLPIAVRSLALFYNKDLFKAAGLDPNKPPQTWDELVADAKKMTVMTDDGRYKQEGFGWNVSGQGYHTFEEVLLRQYGVTPFSDDGRTVQWDSKPGGFDAYQFWMNMTMKDKIGTPDFNTDYSTAFLAGKAGMIIDGSFRLGDMKDAKFDWGVTELPVREAGGMKSNYASYWTNAIATGVSGAKLKAAEKFLKFLISEDVQKDWLKNIGEIPAGKSLSNDKDILDNAQYAPFAKALSYAHTTFFVNEDASRNAFIDATNESLLNNVPLADSWKKLVASQQKVRDDFFGK